jgi:glycosyltransferase involved in cell wall biosynthesis
MTRRVLFVTQTAHVWGGLEVWLDEIVPWLRTRGWHPVVALARGRRFNDPSAYRKAHPSFETVEVDGTLSTREARVAALRRTLRAVRPDLVVPVNIADTLEAVAREKLAGSDVRLLVMLRAIQPHGELEDYRRWREFIDVAVGGNRLRAKLIEAWAGIGDVRTIRTGARRKISNARTSRTNRIRIAYVGRLEEEEKRATDLIGVADALDRLGVAYDLRIAGDGPARASLQRALGERATFLGKVSVDELYASLFPSIDALLLFSTAEAGPQVVWQAMHYGVVPVVSEYRGLRAEGVLRDGETALIFPVGDAERAAEHIARLANDRELLARIAANAQRAIEPDYLLEYAFEQWLRAFEDACTKPRAAGAHLPELAPSGALERLHIPPRIAFALRRAFGRLPEPRDSGDEWPHTCGIDAETFRKIDQLSIELDR